MAETTNAMKEIGPEQGKAAMDQFVNQSAIAVVNMQHSLRAANVKLRLVQARKNSNTDKKKEQFYAQMETQALSAVEQFSVELETAQAVLDETVSARAESFPASAE